MMIKHNFGAEYSISFRKVDINDSELLQKFRCEYSAIREFIQNKSIDSEKDVSYVFVDEENNNIMGFCAICCTGILVSETAFDGTDFLTSIPAVEIDYFAVDEQYRSLKFDEASNRYETLSQAFFVYMLDYIREISSEYVGATHICLYAVPKAVNFYKRCGFESFCGYMRADELPYLNGCTPMFLKIDK